MSDIVNELAARGHDVSEQDQAEAMRQLQTALESTEHECNMLRAEIVILEHRLSKCAREHCLKNRQQIVDNIDK